MKIELITFSIDLYSVVEYEASAATAGTLCRALQESKRSTGSNKIIKIGDVYFDAKALESSVALAARVDGGRKVAALQVIDAVSSKKLSRYKHYVSKNA